MDETPYKAPTATERAENELSDDGGELSQTTAIILVLATVIIYGSVIYFFS